jgi:hypothetical protein
MYYFSTFPLTSYSVNNGANRLVIDITKRFTINQLIKNASITYYTYHVQDGERPDTVANKFYKDPRLDWLVLMVNEIQDPQFSWVMDNYSLEQYIRQKYGSVSNAQAQNHHYEQIVQKKEQIRNTDGELVNAPEITVIVDFATYNTLPGTSRKSVSKYDYEVNLNDDHRQINLIDPSNISLITRSYKGLFA